MSDITICALCKKHLCAPKLLPCLDSFCLKCLEDLAPDGVPGDKVTCPTCDSSFTIPDVGVSALPANSFVDYLLRMRRSREDDKDLECDVCATEAVKSIPVTSFCLDCGQNMCVQCSSYHVKFASTKDHKVMTRGQEESASVKMEDTDWCDRHKNRREELYCSDCGSAICIKCYTEKHNSHTCSDIGEAAGEFREQMQRNVEEMEQLAIESQSEERDLRRARDNILDQVTEVERLVLGRREELISCVEQDTKELMNDLQCFRDCVTSEFDISSNIIRKRSEMIDNFTQFTRELIKEGSASAVTNVTSIINQRASDIRAQHKKSRIRKRPSVDVTFQPLGLSRLSRAKNKRKINLVGRVTATIVPVEIMKPGFWKPAMTWMSTKKHSEPVFKFGSAPSSTEAASDTPSVRTKRTNILRSRQSSQPFGAHKEAAAPSCGDGLIQPRPQSKQASVLSSSDEESVQSSDEDVVSSLAAEANNEDAASAQKSSLETDIDDNSSATTVIFSHKAKLYRFSSASWRLRGVGDLELVQLREKNIVYLLMKNNQVRYATHL